MMIKGTKVKVVRVYTKTTLTLVPEQTRGSSRLRSKLADSEGL